MHIDEICSFYGEDRGWHMFDGDRVTREVGSYLTAEADSLHALLDAGDYDQLVEVGCGYGRYLDWALSRGLSYVGVDIVPWMIKVAELRLTAARAKYQAPRCSVFVHEAEKLSSLKILRRPGRPVKALIFFPFNCFGNVSKIDKVIDSLSDLEADCAISTFKIDAVSTKARKEYYEACGYKNLNTRIVRTGLLFNSDEGFHAMAYNHSFLVDSFTRKGFTLKQMYDLPIGCLIHLNAQKTVRNEKLIKTQQPESSGSNDKKWLRGNACCIQEDPLLPGSQLDNGRLLPMLEVSGHLQMQSPGKILFRGAQDFQDGTIVRLVVSLDSQDSETPSHADLVGYVIGSSIASDDKVDTVIQLSKYEQALIDLIFK